MSTSFFWDGVTYQNTNFTQQFDNYLQRGDSFPHYVVAGYYQDFDVISVSANTVVVGPGAAYVRGYFYVSDANITLTTSTAGGAARSDMIVLTLDTAAQTVRMSLIEGSVAPTASQLMLYTIYRPVGQAAPVDKDVADTRQFLVGQDYLNYYNLDNLIPNSEFLAFSAISTAGATDPPDNWFTVGAPTSISTVNVNTVYTNWRRGRGVQIVGNAGTGMGISIPLVLNSTTINNETNDIITVTGRALVTAGSVKIRVTTLATPGATSTSPNEKETTLYATGNFTLRVKNILNTPAHLNIEITADSAGSTVAVGPMKACYGYVTGTPDHGSDMLLMFNDVVTDANWNGTVGYSTNTYTINLDSAFSNIVQQTQVKGAIVRLRIRDSGSAAAGAATLIIKSYTGPLAPFIEVHVEGSPNDSWVERVAYIPLNTEWNGVAVPPANARFKAEVVATGANTMDVYIGVVGLIV